MQQLLNPFAQKYPESTEASLPAAANSAAFNPSGPFAGHYLACGGVDGLVEVWDMETRGVVRSLEGHVKAVGSVSWSRNNRYLLSASLDSTAIIWDLSFLPNPLLRPSGPSSQSAASASTQRVRTIRFDAPVASASFHPRNCNIVLATLACNEVVLLDLREGGGMWVLEDAMEGEKQDQAMDVDGEGDAPVTPAAEEKKMPLTCAAWSPCGSRIYAGTSGGMLLTIDPLTRHVINRVRVANHPMRQIALDMTGKNLIANSTDRALRTLVVDPRTGALEPAHRFQDQVNRTPWHAIGFSGDGEYVMGGAGHKMAHNVFVWDRESGVLVIMLGGPREPLLDCVWHPTRPLIVSVSTSGDAHIWQTSSPDNWAAFAPGFEELEENVEYDEREDEFDIEDETDLIRRKDAEEDLVIDVLSPSDDYPRRPQPLLTIPAGLTPEAGSSDTPSVESEEVRAVRAAQAVKDWADRDPDDDTWEGFYLSVDLLEPLEEDAA